VKKAAERDSYPYGERERTFRERAGGGPFFLRKKSKDPISAKRKTAAHRAGGGIFFRKDKKKIKSEGKKTSKEKGAA